MIRLFLCILAFLLGGYGYLAIVNPQDAIYIQNMFRFKEFTPTERYIRLTRYSGIFYIVLAVLVIVGTFVFL